MSMQNIASHFKRKIRVGNFERLESKIKVQNTYFNQ